MTLPLNLTYSQETRKEKEEETMLEGRRKDKEGVRGKKEKGKSKQEI